MEFKQIMQAVEAREEAQAFDYEVQEKEYSEMMASLEMPESDTWLSDSWEDMPSDYYM